MRRGAVPAGLIITLFLSILLVIGGVMAVMGVARKPSIPLKPTDMDFPPAIEAAVQKFAARGGSYEWGTNDCSVFVLDFLKASGLAIKQRLTTKELFDVGVMREVGLDQIPTPEQTGEVVVFRYMERRPAGHCGLVVRHGEALMVVHNASSAGGVMVETWDEFLNRAESFGAPRDSVRVFRIQAANPSAQGHGRLQT